MVAGSAVGLGNIWRFPYEVGSHGGAIFLLIYLLCVICFGLPLMVSEMAVGRHAQCDAGRAFGRMGGGKGWRVVGLLGVTAGTLILCYYGVVAGWALDYLLRAGLNGFGDKTPEMYAASFNAFVSSPWRPILCMVVFMIINTSVILAGVKKGIEGSSKIMMPLLFIFIIALAIACMTLRGADAGVAFLFKPDLSKFTSASVFSAMGQCFYSLSLSMGCICTYASFFRREGNLVGNAVSTIVIDTLVAVLAGVIIFATAFSVGIQPDAGPSLVFITLPTVFRQVFVAQPLLCYIFSLGFYILLFIATLTSAMGLLEVPTAFLEEEFHLRRRTAAVLCTLFCLFFGIICSLSMGIWDDHKILGMNFFSLFDCVTAKILLPVGGILIAIYVGWVADKKTVFNEVTNSGSILTKFFPFLYTMLRYVVPVAILAILLNQFGIV